MKELLAELQFAAAYHEGALAAYTAVQRRIEEIQEGSNAAIAEMVRHAINEAPFADQVDAA